MSWNTCNIERSPFQAVCHQLPSEITITDDYDHGQFYHQNMREGANYKLTSLHQNETQQKFKRLITAKATTTLNDTKLEPTRSTSAKLMLEIVVSTEQTSQKPNSAPGLLQSQAALLHYVCLLHHTACLSFGQGSCLCMTPLSP